MYHFLAVHVRQPPGDIFELLGRSRVRGAIDGENEAYKFEQIDVHVGPDEFGEISMFHPFRHHDESV